MTLTEHTRHDVVDRMGVPPDRIFVVPPGLARGGSERDPEDDARVRNAYGLGDRPFFIYPTITYPHKNHLTLVRAFAQLAARRARSAAGAAGRCGRGGGGRAGRDRRAAASAAGSGGPVASRAATSTS